MTVDRESREYLSITEAAGYFDIKRSTIEHYFRKRELDFVMVGNARHFRKSDIRQLIDDFRPNQHLRIKHWYYVEDIMETYLMTRRQVYQFTSYYSIPHKKSGKKACYAKVNVDKICRPWMFDRSMYYTADELCISLHISKDRLYYIVNVMNLPKIRYGRTTWILRTAIDEVLTN
jgi:excisionase family DNA binding protein